MNRSQTPVHVQGGSEDIKTLFHIHVHSILYIILPDNEQAVLNSPRIRPMSVDVVPRDTDISARKTPSDFTVPTRKHPCRKIVSTMGKYEHPFISNIIFRRRSLYQFKTLCGSTRDFVTLNRTSSRRMLSLNGPHTCWHRISLRVSHTIATTSRRPLTTTFFWVVAGGCQRSANVCRWSLTSRQFVVRELHRQPLADLRQPPFLGWFSEVFGGRQIGCQNSLVGERYSLQHRKPN